MIHRFSMGEYLVGIQFFLFIMNGPHALNIASRGTATFGENQTEHHRSLPFLGNFPLIWQRLRKIPFSAEVGQ